jgi:hypothetical protein
MGLTDKQVEAICEWADGLREAGLRWDEIEGRLEGQVPEDVLEGLESLHRAWSRKRLAERLTREEREEELDGDRVAAEGGSSAGVPMAESSGAAVIQFLAECLIGRKPRKNDVRWSKQTAVALPPGHDVERRVGPGEAAGVRWWCCAVLLVEAGEVRKVWAEARVRQISRAGNKWGARQGFRGAFLRLEFLRLDGERLNEREIVHRLAALFHAYLGTSGTGIRNNVHLAELTETTRQNISQMKQRVAAKHFARVPGSRAGFEGMQSSRRIREKVQKGKGPDNSNRPRGHNQNNA